MVDVRAVAAPDSEWVVVTTLARSPEWFQSVGARLEPEAFSLTGARLPFELMAELYAQGKQWTITILAQILRERGHNEWIVDYANHSDYIAFSEAELAIEVEHLRQTWACRRLQDLGVAMLRDWTPGTSALDLVDPTRENLERISMLLTSNVASRVQDVMASLLALIRGGSRRGGTCTSLPAWDNKCGGLQPGRLYVVGARPSCGKTAMAVTIAVESARRGAEILAITTETTKENFGNRLLGFVSGLDAYDILMGRVSEQTLIGHVANVPPNITIIDAAYSVKQIWGEVFAWRKVHAGKPCVLLVDYIELVQVDKQRSREEEVSTIIMALQRIAKQANVAVVAMSQLKRLPEERTDGPTMGDLRYSGMIEQAADCIWLLWRPNKNVTSPLQLRATIAKNKIAGLEFTQDLLLYQGQSRIVEVTI